MLYSCVSVFVAPVKMKDAAFLHAIILGVVVRAVPFITPTSKLTIPDNVSKEASWVVGVTGVGTVRVSNVLLMLSFSLCSLAI